MNLVKNIRTIKDSISDEIKLIIVTKDRSIREMNQLVFLGATDFGENRIQEAKSKKISVKSGAKWHMIGHLQSNKAVDAVEIFDMIQSVDSLKLARKIDSTAKIKGRKMAILVQVNIAREPQKHGFPEDELLPALIEMSKLKNIKILGLMMIAPFGEPQDARPHFKSMKNLFDMIKNMNIQNIDMNYLSMGMSNDYKTAAEEGANMVRLGNIIFNGNNENRTITGMDEEKRD